MKRIALFLLIACAVFGSYAQEGSFRSPKEVQQRIDVLLRNKQYTAAPKGFDTVSLVSLGTAIVKDTATTKLGHLKKRSKKKYKLAYLVKYSIGADKIVSIAPPKKKKKKFLLF